MSFRSRTPAILRRWKSRLHAAIGGAFPVLIAFSSEEHLLACALVGGLSMFVCAMLLPRYSAFAVAVEDRINLRLGRVTPARMMRLFFHLPLVAAVIAVTGVIAPEAVQPHAIAVLIGASGGLHASAVSLAYHGYGDRSGNTILAFAASLLLISICTLSADIPYAYVLGAVFLLSLLSGALADLRAAFFPRWGVGVFFGTFNPVHQTHLRILRDALEHRHLRKIYIHPTTVPKLHRVALERGEIAVTRHAGMRQYEKTALADPHKNYFPTGNRFYEYRLRSELLKAALRDAGLQNAVEVLDLPEIYERSGFFGIIRHVSRQNSGEPLHGLHGSDPGGMWVRNIFEDSGWIYPFPVIRSDDISATAIRAGVVGLASPTVEKFLAASRAGSDFVFPSGYVFRNTDETASIAVAPPAASPVSSQNSQCQRIGRRSAAADLG